MLLGLGLGLENLCIVFHDSAMWAVLVLHGQEQEILFHFLMSSSVSFFQSTLISIIQVFYFLG